MWQTDELSQNDDKQEQCLYEVEKILSKRCRRQNGQNRCEYLIKWKGYPRLQDQTWQPIEHLQNVVQLVSEFDNRQKKQKKIQNTLTKEDSNKREFQDKDKKRSQAIDKLTKKIKTDVIHNQHQRNKVVDNIKQPNLIQAKNLLVRLQQNKQTQKEPLKSFKKDNIISDSHQISHKFAEKNNQQKKYSLREEIKANQKYGKIVNHLYKNQQLFYEVEVFNQNKNFDRIEIRRASELRKYCSQQISEYLENYIIFLIKYNKAQK